MKKLFSLLFCMVFCVCGMQAQKPFYVHLKNGRIEVLYADLVDSITTVLDEQENDTYVCYQKFWTEDSVYVFDVSKIDSISYVTPPTRYKPGVTKLEDGLLQYVTACDSMTLKISDSAPKQILPSKGDRLVCLEMTEILPIGFAGQVTDVRRTDAGWDVECTHVSLTDIFECYYGVSSQKRTISSLLQDSVISRRQSDFVGWCQINPGTLSISLKDMLKGVVEEDHNNKYESSFNLRADVSYEPHITIYASVIVNDGVGSELSLTIKNDQSIKLDLAMTGKLACEFKLPIGGKITPEVYLGQPFIKAYFLWGVFFRASTEISLSNSTELMYTSYMHFTWCSDTEKNLKDAFNPFIYKGCKNTVEGGINGSLQAGAYGEVGVNFVDKNIAKMYAEIDVGAELRGDYVLLKEDFNNKNDKYSAYEKLSNSKIVGQCFVGCSAAAETIGKLHMDLCGSYTLPMFDPFLEVSMVPSFSGTDAYFSKDAYKMLNVSTNVYGNSLPVDVGFIIHDENNTELDKRYLWRDYTGEMDEPCQTIFEYMPRNKKLFVSPIVSLMGNEVLAYPTKEVQCEPEAVTGDALSVGETTAKLVGGFYNIPEAGAQAGIEYGGTCVTADIYRDGEMEFDITGLTEKTTYEYRAFVKWNETYYYGDYRKFTTKEKPVDPDDPNPDNPDNPDQPTAGEIVDMGLSVKWATCNVGASRPEEYGKYFAWGEIADKANYEFKDYSLGWEDENYYWHYKDIGKDISGNPKYDAATAIYGNGARIPTKEEYRELMEKCDKELTELNGVFGLMLTSKANGNKIFLPATGYKYSSWVDEAGEFGWYWTSNVYPDNEQAYCFMYNSDMSMIGILTSEREYGNTIRAVYDK